MAGRRTFFSFHYQRDIWRTSIVRHSNVVAGRSAAGWQDASIWESARKKGDKAVHALINRALSGTSVTVVLIGEETWKRRYVKYEIEKSLQRGNGILGIFIHNLADQKGKTSERGKIPKLLLEHRVPCHDWHRERFGRWVETAAIRAGHPCRAHKEKKCLICRIEHEVLDLLS